MLMLYYVRYVRIWFMHWTHSQITYWVIGCSCHFPWAQKILAVTQHKILVVFHHSYISLCLLTQMSSLSRCFCPEFPSIIVTEISSNFYYWICFTFPLLTCLKHSLHHSLFIRLFPPLLFTSSFSPTHLFS